MAATVYSPNDLAFDYSTTHSRHVAAEHEYQFEKCKRMGKIIPPQHSFCHKRLADTIYNTLQICRPSSNIIPSCTLNDS